MARSTHNQINVQYNEHGRLFDRMKRHRFEFCNVAVRFEHGWATSAFHESSIGLYARHIADLVIRDLRPHLKTPRPDGSYDRASVIVQFDAVRKRIAILGLWDRCPTCYVHPPASTIFANALQSTMPRYYCQDCDDTAGATEPLDFYTGHTRANTAQQGN